MHLKQKDIDIWPLWNETEKEIREVIKYFLINELGDDWEDAFLRKHINKKESLDRLQKQRLKNIKSFGFKLRYSDTRIGLLETLKEFGDISKWGLEMLEKLKKEKKAEVGGGGE